MVQAELGRVFLRVGDEILGSQIRQDREDLRDRAGICRGIDRPAHPPAIGFAALLRHKLVDPARAGDDQFPHVAGAGVTTDRSRNAIAFLGSTSRSVSGIVRTTSSFVELGVEHLSRCVQPADMKVEDQLGR